MLFTNEFRTILIICQNFFDSDEKPQARPQDDWRSKYGTKLWVAEIRDNKSEVFCKFCAVSISALKSHIIEHAKSVTHNKQIDRQNKQNSRRFSDIHNRTSTAIKGRAFCEICHFAPNARFGPTVESHLEERCEYCHVRILTGTIGRLRHMKLHDNRHRCIYCFTEFQATKQLWQHSILHVSWLSLLCPIEKQII